MELSRSHPFVILLFFMANIIITMLTKNPVFIFISFSSVVVYSLILKRPKQIYKPILFITLLLIISTFTNPLFNNYGETVLFSLGKTKFTFESMSYGFITGLMLISLVLWFRNYNILMSTDKFRYLFSKYLPHTALIISLVLKLIPEMFEKIDDIINASKTTGAYYRQNFFGKLRNRFNVLGVVFSWAIEYSMQTAISMKARGYELKNKSKFIIYKYRFSDLFKTILILSSLGLIIYFGFDSLLNYNYFPIMEKLSFNYQLIIALATFGLLTNLGTFIQIKESIKWRYLESKIYHSPIV